MDNRDRGTWSGSESVTWVHPTVRVRVGTQIVARENLQTSGGIFSIYGKKGIAKFIGKKKIAWNSLNREINADQNSRSLTSDGLFSPISRREKVKERG